MSYNGYFFEGSYFCESRYFGYFFLVAQFALKPHCFDPRFFVGKYFVVRLLTTKTTKILPPEKYIPTVWYVLAFMNSKFMGI